MNPKIKKKVSIGILAHVDAGKTTITEKLLVATGTIKQAGNVDKGTSISDSLKVEKERGISVKASAITFYHNNLQINLIDTPGHSDFAAEIPRALSILDLVILVISASEGIEAQTQFLWDLCKQQKIPVIIFINKIDQIGADIEKVMEEIHSQLNLNAVLLHQQNSRDNLIEIISHSSDEILEAFMNDGEIPEQLLESSFQKCANNGNLFPVLAGSAKFDQGIKNLIDLIDSIQPLNSEENHTHPTLQVFKIDYRENHRQEVFAKVLSGEIEVRNSIKNNRTGLEEKINYLTLPLTPKRKQVDIIKAGDIAIIEGLSSAMIGDLYGNDAKMVIYTPMESAFTVQVKAEYNENYPQLAEALSLLNREEPNLNFIWLKEEREFHLDVNGLIHMQVITQILRDRFNLEAKFGKPGIIYKETPIKTGTGYVEYTMPKPCWAVATFKIEPGKRGSGVKYSSKVSVDKVKSKYQKEVQRTIPKALEQGIKGWEVTDLIITLIDGEDHEMHSRPSDFIIATPMGIMNGLQRCGTKLLEPVMSFTLTVPNDKSGRAMSDITRMRGSFEAPKSHGIMSKIEGLIPAATSAKYQMEVSSYTSGKGIFFTSFHSYQDCPPGEGLIRSYRGISPLNRSKYILKARKAITESYKQLC